MLLNGIKHWEIWKSGPLASVLMFLGRLIPDSWCAFVGYCIVFCTKPIWVAVFGPCNSPVISSLLDDQFDDLGGIKQGYGGGGN